MNAESTQVMEPDTAAGPAGDLIYDLVIVGYGPSGVTAANLAILKGMRIAVVEKDTEVFPRQRAISCDDEVMRVFQTIGLVAPIRATMHEGVTSTFVTSKGKTLLSLASTITHNGYHQRNFFHQPYLESELRKGVLRREDLADLYFGAEVLSVEDGPDFALVTSKDVATGETQTLRGKYVLACDGGSSSVRKSLGLAMEGKSLPDPWFDVQGEALGKMPGSPHFKFVCDPKRAGVDCPCPAGMHRYEWRLNPDEDPTEITENGKVWDTISRLAQKTTGNPSVSIDERDLEMKRTWRYVFQVRRAANWRSGRILLVGDAAHLMPAFAGAGMASAIRDTVNVVWKIHEVLAGRAADTLLDTYQQERGPHVEAFTKYAEKLGRIVQVKSPVLALLRNAYYRTLRHIPGLRAYTTTMKGKPVPGFSEGFVAASTNKKTPAGRTFPNVDVGTEHGRMLIDDYIGYNFAVFGLDEDPRTLLDAEEVRAWERLGARFIRIRTGTLLAGTDEVGDPVGRLWEWFQSHKNARLAVVRPDHIVYGVDTDEVRLIPDHLKQTARSSTGAHR
ncbi:hypothetical protein BLJ79_16645 [Arthrobacter sp. UCD-GKA]|uniref:FAD-dependent monooxygenase n=1 Tax=Arthrobacter sp. UCD-GKA TaxID=1913576 RepID=UPI0008DC6A80|nr:FAD-dependent monooxygenase [Arthrobacter sp. UCD-GKA]OIH83215.1 hypothetical protein BLJ79_16645 [Arthrobacter sp. UCD-GKA]